MTIIQALENALIVLKEDGYHDGPIHDDLKQAIERLKCKYPETETEEL